MTWLSRHFPGQGNSVPAHRKHGIPSFILFSSHLVSPPNHSPAHKPRASSSPQRRSGIPSRSYSRSSLGSRSPGRELLSGADSRTISPWGCRGRRHAWEQVMGRRLCWRRLRMSMLTSMCVRTCLVWWMDLRGE